VTREEAPKWKRVFAWKPIKINNKWHWLKMIYRKDTELVIYYTDTVFGILQEEA